MKQGTRDMGHGTWDMKQGIWDMGYEKGARDVGQANWFIVIVISCKLCVDSVDYMLSVISCSCIL